MFQSVAFARTIQYKVDQKDCFTAGATTTFDEKKIVDYPTLLISNKPYIPAVSLVNSFINNPYTSQWIAATKTINISARDTSILSFTADTNHIVYKNVSIIIPDKILFKNNTLYVSCDSLKALKDFNYVYDASAKTVNVIYPYQSTQSAIQQYQVMSPYRSLNVKSANIQFTVDGGKTYKPSGCTFKKTDIKALSCAFVFDFPYAQKDTNFELDCSCKTANGDIMPDKEQISIKQGECGAGWLENEHIPTWTTGTYIFTITDPVSKEVLATGKMIVTDF